MMIQNNSFLANLFGGGNSAKIIGTQGADTIFGGYADDTLTGGAGVDTFKIYAASNFSPIPLLIETDALAVNVPQPVITDITTGEKINVYDNSFNLVDGSTATLIDEKLVIDFDGSSDTPDDQYTITLEGTSGGRIAYEFVAQDQQTGDLAKLEITYTAPTAGGGGDTPPVTPPSTGGGGTSPVTPPVTPPAAGNEGPDTLVGDALANEIMAGESNDSVSAGDGADTVFGNQGDDLLFGNQGQDLIYAGQGNDEVCAGQDNDTAFGNKGDDVVFGNKGDDQVFGNEGSDTLFGNEGADFLHGGQGDDTVFGGQDNDVLNGGLGDDVLQGGLGSDVFVFAASQGNDIVTDFDFAQGDRLDLQGQSYSLTTAGDGSAALLLDGGGVIILQGVTEAEFNAGYVA